MFDVPFVVLFVLSDKVSENSYFIIIVFIEIKPIFVAKPYLE